MVFIFSGHLQFTAGSLPGWKIAYPICNKTIPTRKNITPITFKGEGMIFGLLGNRRGEDAKLPVIENNPSPNARLGFAQQ
jgi:hypothetical protein